MLEIDSAKPQKGVLKEDVMGWRAVRLNNCQTNVMMELILARLNWSRATCGKWKDGFSEIPSYNGGLAVFSSNFLGILN